MVKNGLVVEQGRHSDLLKRESGFYAQLVAHHQSSDTYVALDGDKQSVKPQRRVLRESVLKRSSVRLSGKPTY